MMDSKQLSTTFVSSETFIPYSTIIFELVGKVCDIDIPFGDEHSINSYSLHVDQFINYINCLMLQKEASKMRIERDALIYEYKVKYLEVI